MNPTTTTKTTFRAVLRSNNKDGECFAKTYGTPRAALAEADADAIRINGSDHIRPADDVVVEGTIVTTSTWIVH